MKSQISQSLPDWLRPIAQDVYYSLSSERHPREIRESWQGQFEWDRIVSELDREFEEVIHTLDQMNNSGEMNREQMKNLYVVTRSMEPQIVVETGVCNGASTYAILRALEENGHGKLHSIDFPLRSDDSYEEFVQKTFDGIGKSMIPADKGPGWVVPDRLRDRWKFSEGKSQHLLPGVISEDVDLFIHDSEHSTPCMMFEMEIAWQTMNDGMIIIDDINWNGAFDTFTEVRCDEWGLLSRSQGYIVI